ncbi:MAG: hypothetical protein ACRCWQ_12475, partial [Bacilli bacterium]
LPWNAIYSMDVIKIDDNNNEIQINDTTYACQNLTDFEYFISLLRRVHETFKHTQPDVHSHDYFRKTKFSFHETFSYRLSIFSYSTGGARKCKFDNAFQTYATLLEDEWPIYLTDSDTYSILATNFGFHFKGENQTFLAYRAIHTMKKKIIEGRTILFLNEYGFDLKNLSKEDVLYLWDKINLVKDEFSKF